MYLKLLNHVAFSFQMYLFVIRIVMIAYPVWSSLSRGNLGHFNKVQLFCMKLYTIILLLSTFITENMFLNVFVHISKSKSEKNILG